MVICLFFPLWIDIYFLFMSVSFHLTRARVYLYVRAFVCVSRPLKCFLITGLHKETYLSRRGYVRCGSSLTTLVGRDAGQRLSVLRHNSYFGVGGKSVFVSLQTDMSVSQPYELSLFLAYSSPSIHSSNSTYNNMYSKQQKLWILSTIATPLWYAFLCWWKGGDMERQLAACCSPNYVQCILGPGATSLARDCHQHLCVKPLETIYSLISASKWMTRHARGVAKGQGKGGGAREIALIYDSGNYNN